MIIVQLGVIIFLCQVLSCGFAEELPCTPGFDSESFVFKVRSDHLESGKRLGKIIFNACDGRSRSVFQSGNKRFAVRTDGSVRTKTLVTLNEGQIKFNVHAWDSSGMKHTTSVRVECTAHHHTNTAVDVTQQIESSDDVVMEFPRSSAGLKRAKRGWVIPPLRESENKKGPFPQFLAQIKSDFAAEVPLTYSITGEGADLPPVGLFTCDKLTGSVYVTQPLDREKKASYKLIAHAVGEGGVKEKPMEIIIDVIDQNDNKPQFTQNPFNGNVPDAAPKDYEFMTVTATDADDPETDNAEVRYKIISQDPPSPNPNMFDINAVTGGIRVNSEGLDREKWSNYTLVIEAADMEGNGYPTTSKAVITVTDSNDNPPQFKRGFIIPPLSQPENSRGPFPKMVAHIKSDYAAETKLTYSITGEGADLPPVGLFTCDRRTGALYVTQPLDREKKASYKLIAHAVGEGSIKEKPIEIIINVIDQNDNKPQFTQNPFNGNVPDAAPKDYEFMTVTATDADDPNTDNADLRYSIISQDPPSPNPNMFDINAVTGGIRVNSEGLNREKWSNYTLVIQAADMQGNGYPTTSKAVIIVTDSNDNPPQFKQTEYTVSVPENQVGVEVANLTVTDGDEPGSPAWSTKYKIISGDEGGFFSVSTGSSQLEGFITTVKPLDFEVTKQFILSVIVENDHPFAGSLPTSTATVTVNVLDEQE
nr:cadherin-1 [Misgurnus anguillicaudatus]